MFTVRVFISNITIQGLYDEVNPGWEQGVKPFGIHLLQRHNFFAVYDGNTAKLGLFRPLEAMTRVRAYGLAKCHLERVSLAAELTEQNNNQRLPDELGRGLRREAMQIRQVVGEVAQMLAPYVGKPEWGDSLPRNKG